jgi:hypothetical protein
MLLVITLADCKVDVLETQHGTYKEGVREIQLVSAWVTKI